MGYFASGQDLPAFNREPGADTASEALGQLTMFKGPPSKQIRNS